ncbi:MAG TPA: hypothetical protein VNJ08_10290 [Bacteriovoracaceae bacterium]|nr:hypothetical protein [Bacteriovoracaceae bacterium]
MLYVLEGSTLGGQVIHQRLLAKGIFPEVRSICFHHPYGPLVREKWEDFKLVLNELPDDCTDDALFMAKATFTALKNWMKGTLIVP